MTNRPTRRHGDVGWLLAPVAIILMVLAAWLTGCSIGNLEVPPSTSTVPTTPPPPGSDEEFFSLLNGHPEVTASDSAKSASISLAKASCGVLDQGGTLTQIIARIDQNYLTVQRAIIFAGIFTYCPQHIAEIGIYQESSN